MSCEKPAVALLTFSARDAKAWLYDLHEPDATGGLMLCRKHANATVVPMSWQLVDGRDPAWTGPTAEAPIAAPAPVAAPAPAPAPVPAPAAEVPAPAAAPIPTPIPAPADPVWGAEVDQAPAVVPVVPAPAAHAPSPAPVAPPVNPYPHQADPAATGHDATLFQLSLNDLPSPRGY